MAPKDSQAWNEVSGEVFYRLNLVEERVEGLNTSLITHSNQLIEMRTILNTAVRTLGELKEVTTQEIMEHKQWRSALQINLWFIKIAMVVGCILASGIAALLGYASVSTKLVNVIPNL